MGLQDVRDRLLTRAIVSVVGFTVVLTAAFVGLVAHLSADVAGFGGRIPFYVLVMAVAFLLALWQLDEADRDGITVLVAVTGIAVVAGVLGGLAVEGFRYIVLSPSAVLNSSLLVYFLSAAIICTGLGSWGLRHWREFTRTDVPEEPVET